MADGLAHDVITRLAKLRSLFVIGQGTVFALDQRSVGAEEAGRTLNVDYVASGSLRREGGTRRRERAAHRNAHRTHRLGGRLRRPGERKPFGVLAEIGDRIVASIDNQIEMAERNRAILKAPNSLDAWEAYHRGLWHMYRYNKADNDRARAFLSNGGAPRSPRSREPYSGLSFTHFQNAFQRWTPREPEIDRAFETAGQGLIADDLDPSAHWAMGGACASRPPGAVS